MYRPLVVLWMALFAAWPADAGRVYHFNSRHYRVRTDLPRDEARLIAFRMDRIHDAYVQRFGSFDGSSPSRMPLVLLARRRDYLAYLNKQGIDARGTGGYFTGKALATHVRGHPYSRLMHVLRHEGFHQFAARRIDRRLPPWVSEGLAEYFADSIIGEDESIVGLAAEGRVNAVHQAVKANTWLPLGELLSINRKQWRKQLASPAGYAAPLYQQAWSVVHFLVHGEGGRYRAAFEKYLRQLGAGRSHRDAWRRSFDVELDTLVTQWKGYCRKLKVSPWAKVREELRWLGKGLSGLDEKGLTPTSVRQMYEALDREGYPIVERAKSVMGGQAFDLQLIAPEAPSLPPSLRVTGQDETVVHLRWSRLKTGRLVPMLTVE